MLMHRQCVDLINFNDIGTNIVKMYASFKEVTLWIIIINNDMVGIGSTHYDEQVTGGEHGGSYEGKLFDLL